MPIRIHFKFFIKTIVSIPIGLLRLDSICRMAILSSSDLDHTITAGRDPGVGRFPERKGRGSRVETTRPRMGEDCLGGAERKEVFNGTVGRTQATRRGPLRGMNGASERGFRRR